MVIDLLRSEALEERVEPNDREGDPARARPRRIRLDEEPGVLAELPEHLVPDATVRGSPEEPRIPPEAGVEIGHRDTGEEVGDRALHVSPSMCLPSPMRDPRTVGVIRRQLKRRLRQLSARAHADRARPGRRAAADGLSTNDMQTSVQSAAKISFCRPVARTASTNSVSFHELTVVRSSGGSSSSSVASSSMVA